MSIYGYKKKGKPANWTTVSGALAQAEPKKPKWIRSVSKRMASTKAKYRKMAAEFVAAAVARGETCPVVHAIESLRTGMKYGHPISAKLSAVHHKRGRVGALLLDTRFWMCVSREGHRFIHSNIAKARENGWICETGLWNKPLH